MEYKALIEEVKKLTKDELDYLIFELLTTENVSYNHISNLYVNYLETKDKLSIKKESLFANCLSSSISKSYLTKEWFHSQAFVLLEKWSSNEWIKKYLNKRNKKYINKNLELLK